MSSKLPPKDPGSGMVQGSLSPEEEKEVLDAIENLVSGSRGEVTAPVPFRPKKSGILVPLMINLAAGGLVVGGALGAQWYFANQATAIKIQAVSTYESAEGQVLERIIAESRSQLEAKNREINDIQTRLVGMGADRVKLKSEAEAQIQAKEAQGKTALLEAMATEKKRLVSQGLAPGALESQLKTFEVQKKAAIEQDLDAFRKKVLADLKLKTQESEALEAKLKSAQLEQQKILSSLDEATAKARPEAQGKLSDLEEEQKEMSRLGLQGDLLMGSFRAALEIADYDAAQKILTDMEKISASALKSPLPGVISRGKSLQSGAATLGKALSTLKLSGNGAGPGEALKVRYERASQTKDPEARARELQILVNGTPGLKELFTAMDEMRIAQESQALDLGLRRAAAQLTAAGPEKAFDAYLDLVAPPGSLQARRTLARELKSTSAASMAELRSQLTRTLTELGQKIKEKDAALAVSIPGPTVTVVDDQALKRVQGELQDYKNQVAALSLSYQKARDAALTRLAQSPLSIGEAGTELTRALDSDLGRALFPSLGDLFTTTDRALRETLAAMSPTQESEVRLLRLQVESLKAAQAAAQVALASPRVEIKETVRTEYKQDPALASANESLKSQNKNLMAENQGLKTENLGLKTENLQLKKTLEDQNALAQKNAASWDTQSKEWDNRNNLLLAEQKKLVNLASASRTQAFRDVLDFAAYLGGSSAAASQSRAQIESKTLEDEAYAQVVYAIQGLMKSGNRESLIRSEKSLVLGPLLSFSGDKGVADPLTVQGKKGQTIQIRRVTDREEQVLAYGQITSLGTTVSIQITKSVPGAPAPQSGDIVFVVIE